MTVRRACPCPGVRRSAPATSPGGMRASGNCGRLAVDVGVTCEGASPRTRVDPPAEDLSGTFLREEPLMSNTPVAVRTQTTARTPTQSPRAAPPTVARCAGAVLCLVRGWRGAAFMREL